MSRTLWCKFQSPYRKKNIPQSVSVILEDIFYRFHKADFGWSDERPDPKVGLTLLVEKVLLAFSGIGWGCSRKINCRQ